MCALLYKQAFMSTAAICAHGGSHQDPVPGAETMSLCPHQGHTRLCTQCEFPLRKYCDSDSKNCNVSSLHFEKLPLCNVSPMSRHMNLLLLL